MLSHMTAREKENKIKKVLPLVSKAYEQDSFVNEDDKMVHRLAMGLAPNQWLRLEDRKYGARDYKSDINIQQDKTGIKPHGIWASKGEWYLYEDRELTLLEVDYSRILVLTTQEDLLAFEDEYCKKKMKSLSSIDATNRYYARRERKINEKVFGKKSSSKQAKLIKKSKSVEGYTKKRPMCDWAINWHEVSKKYDGIALVPNPDWYFQWGKDKVENYSHTWLRSFDVSSLVIWRQSSGNPITRSINLGYIHELQAEAEKKKQTIDKVILDAFKSS